MNDRSRAGHLEYLCEKPAGGVFHPQVQGRHKSELCAPRALIGLRRRQRAVDPVKAVRNSPVVGIAEVDHPVFVGTNGSADITPVDQVL